MIETPLANSCSSNRTQAFLPRCM